MKINYSMLRSVLYGSLIGVVFLLNGQCPTAGSSITGSVTITANCTVAGNLTVQGGTLTINPGVTLNITGVLNLRGDGTISASSTSIIDVGAGINETWDNGGTNYINGGIWNVTGNVSSGNGGLFTINGVDMTTTGDFIANGSTVTLSNSTFDTQEFDGDAGTVIVDNSQVQADTLYTRGGTTLFVQNSSEVFVTKGMYNSEDLVVDASLLDIGGDLDATGGDVVTVRNGGELIVRGDYKMNNGGGVQMNLETGGLVRVLGDVDSTTGGNSINVGDDSGFSVDGEFTGGSAPTVNVGTGDEGADCLSGGGCCGDAAACPEASILPVELVYFSGKLSNGEVNLEWLTHTEKNNDFFTVYRSVDGLNYEAIAKVAGHGTTDISQTYQWKDRTGLINGIIYYKLSQTDFDGAYEVLDFVVVKRDFQAQSIYPNPVEMNQTIIVSNVEMGSSYAVVDVTGKVVRKNTLTENRIATNGLNKGVYFLKIESNSGMSTHRLVIR